MNFIVLWSVKANAINISDSIWHKSFIQTPKYYIFEDRSFNHGFWDAPFATVSIFLPGKVLSTGRRRRVGDFLLGSLRNHDGYTEDWQRRQKKNFYFTYESRDNLKSFTLFITVKTIKKLIPEHSVKFEKGKKISRRGPRSPVNAKFGHLTSLFCRGQQRNVPRITTHVHSHCSAH